MSLDENFKRLIKDLGDAINDSLSESEKISDVVGRIRSAGYDLFLVLEVTIGFNKRGQSSLVHRQKLDTEAPHEPVFRLTNQDAAFLKAMKISLEEPK